jgi:hypothetical protein
MSRLGMALLVVVAVLAAFAGALIACSSSRPDDSGNGTIIPPSGATCGTPAEGCPCSDDGMVVMCGVDLGKGPDGFEECARGQRLCQNGQWGACVTPTGATSQSSAFNGVHVLSPVLVDAGCSGNACDPYCQQSSFDAGPDGLTAEASTGINTTWEGGADGPPNTTIKGYLTDSGISLDGAIYHELNPGQTAIDPVNLSTTINSVDVYFMINSTTSTEPSIKNLATQMPSVVSALQAAIPSVALGDGNFTNYAAWPYAPQTNGNTVYNNRVGVTTNTAAVVNDFNTMSANASSFFQQTPYVVAQSTTPALYLAATDETMAGWACWDYPGAQPADWWWNAKYYGQGVCNGGNDVGLLQPNIYTAQACANGGIGAACFRPNAYHVIMLLQSAPAMNGAYGSFPYYQYKPQHFNWNAPADYTTENAWLWFYSPSLGGSPTAPVLPTSSGSSQLNSLPSVGSPLVYTGNVVGKSSQSQITALTLYDPSALQKCTVNFSNLGTGPDSYYDFTVPAGGANYWFDTFGSSYDTVLYIINKSTGLLMGCNDDGFQWASTAGVCCGVTSSEWNQSALNSALLGTLPAGNYRLVVDMNGSAPASQNTGLYQLNLWPIIDDPKMSGNPRGSTHSTPSYNQALKALAAPGLGAFVMSVEMSGVTCGQTPASWENAWTRWSLEQYAYSTNAVVGGTPLVYSVKQNGSPGPASGNDPRCPSSANLGTVVSSAIANLTNNLAQPITAIANDFDDLTDYDGVTGVNAGPTVLTPTNIDDSTFVTSIVAQPATGCTGPSGNTYASCGPGSTPNFQVNFAVPSTVTARTNPQIFYFRIELHGTNNTLITSKPVIIVVPPAGSNYTPTSYSTSFDGLDSCPSGSHVQWGSYVWNATTPGNSYIQFFVTAADTAADLGTATEIATPLATAQASPNTQVGSASVSAFLKAQNVAASQQNFLKIRSYLVPTSPGGQQTPVLNSWTMNIDCPPTE